MNILQHLKKIPFSAKDYLIEIVTVFLIFGIVLLFNLSNADITKPETEIKAPARKEKAVSYVSPGFEKERLSCFQYLAICEKSCDLRGGLWKFACLGENFVSLSQYPKAPYKCSCSDDMEVSAQ